VQTVELLGAERLVYGRLGDEQVIVRLDASVPPPAAGETLTVTPRSDALHRFNAQTGKRLGP
jgi:sn-glycerol 3-phosphate transport system ATP-binding protein